MLSPSILIRAAEQDDIPAMAAIRAREWGTDAYWIARIGGYIQGTHSPQQALPERAIFVAVKNHSIVGFVAGHRTQRFECDGEVEWINVTAEQRGLGIASLLLERMLAWFVERKLVRVCVNVEPDNLAARKLYARSGAIPLRSYWMVWEQVSQITPQH